jgi:putative endonuclease
MSERRKLLGARGEELAAAFLEKKRFKILVKNYRCRYGEVDIIARDPDKCLCFIEVKTRSSRSHGTPQEAVNLRKQAQIGKVALEFIQRYKLENKPARFDVAAVTLLPAGHTVELIQNAFELNHF